MALFVASGIAIGVYAAVVDCLWRTSARWEAAWRSR